MTFTELLIKNLKAKDKKYYVSEGNGFTLLVHPTGTKAFYIRYTIADKKKYMKLGEYPHISLAEARVKFNDAKKLIHHDTDPAAPPPEPAATQEELSVQKICDNIY